ncbi:MAG: hypothetical protein D6679_05865 [Candidatus Hydrogenedentota bacterium]|nr:MAG: hypothetical protein D6679_05865 [Candidatus Hydrogenedentota bacterium]
MYIKGKGRVKRDQRKWRKSRENHGKHGRTRKEGGQAQGQGQRQGKEKGKSEKEMWSADTLVCEKRWRKGGGWNRLRTVGAIGRSPYLLARPPAQNFTRRGSLVRLTENSG